jgi:hypothetical protein
MKWISKIPPIYVWQGDFWYNENNGLTYEAIGNFNAWICLDNEQPNIPFPPKTKFKYS